jgi:tetratricopeptide (TPR) repeat protein
MRTYVLVAALAIMLCLAPAQAWLRVGIQLGAFGATTLSLATLQLAHRMEPHDPRPSAARADVFAQIGDMTMAYREYTTALEIEPRYVPALHNQANLLLQWGDYPAALASYAAVLSLRPDDHDARYGRILSALRLRTPVVAIDDAIHVLRDPGQGRLAIEAAAVLLARAEQRNVAEGLLANRHLPEEVLGRIVRCMGLKEPARGCVR